MRNCQASIRSDTHSTSHHSLLFSSLSSPSSNSPPFLVSFISYYFLPPRSPRCKVNMQGPRRRSGRKNRRLMPRPSRLSSNFERETHVSICSHLPIFPRIRLIQWLHVNMRPLSGPWLANPTPQYEEVAPRPAPRLAMDGASHIG